MPAREDITTVERVTVDNILGSIFGSEVADD